MIKLTDAALYYKEQAHQVEAFEWLETQVDPTTLEIFGQKYRDKPEAVVANPLQVPYQSQNDNSSGTGYRECFSSSMAMIAMYWGKVQNDDEYNRIRSKYGDTTSAEAQLATLRSLGLNPKFVTNASIQTLQNEIDNGCPIGVGWLHNGPSSAPSGGGHWTVVIGYYSDGVIMNDPNGEAQLASGGYTNNLNGSGLKYSYKNWEPRWALPSKNDGWAMIVKP
ncbi:MAG: hypothetical protein CBC48_05390 [bacterium TMED88]|nr:MAG: hypothetical protein CBC48_05390 [bacterium TMED88]